MKGLLQKDFCLLKQRKRTAVIYVIVALMLSFTMDSSFIVSYFTMIGCLLGISTISYDEYENGFPFLMTLPINAKIYAVEKYVFCSFGLVLFWLSSIVVQFVSFFIQKRPFDIGEVICMDFIFLPIFLLLSAFMLPIQLKFGSEKSRIVTIILFGIITTIFILGKNILSFFVQDLHIDIESILLKLDAMPKAALPVALFIGILPLVMLSMLISIKIMQKKEF